ncbi:MAG: hypothetical protein HOP10_03115 [Chitinophagaceae bacterium]|nr:hypothetical protein [Chitinophagaceae bacterium]
MIRKIITAVNEFLDDQSIKHSRGWKRSMILSVIIMVENNNQPIGRSTVTNAYNMQIKDMQDKAMWHKEHAYYVNKLTEKDRLEVLQEAWIRFTEKYDATFGTAESTYFYFCFKEALYRFIRKKYKLTMTVLVNDFDSDSRNGKEEIEDGIIAWEGPRPTATRKKIRVAHETTIDEGLTRLRFYIIKGMLTVDEFGNPVFPSCQMNREKIKQDSVYFASTYFRMIHSLITADPNNR